MCETEIQSCPMPQSNRPKTDSIIGFCLALLPWLSCVIGIFFAHSMIAIPDIGTLFLVPACFVLGLCGKKQCSRNAGIAEIILACLLILCYLGELCGFNGQAGQFAAEIWSKMNPSEETQLVSFGAMMAWSGASLATMLLVPAVLFISAGVESIKNAKIRALCEK
ncbi:MAG: hypothetical protein MJ016_07035 [Victivallaceae bacterium]|nr:hypothetical protein [Victivallaceae bacterium]